MKKLLVLGAVVCALSACQHSEKTVVECPSCNPPIRHYEVVTECSDFTEKELSDGSYSQCRHCVNKIYHNGVEVSGLVAADAQVKETKVVRTVRGVRRRSCGQ